MRIFDHFKGDFDREFDQFKTGDSGSGTEIMLRRVLTLVVGGLLWAGTQESLMLFWCFGVLLIDSVYVTFLRKVSAPVSARQLLGAMVGSTMLGGFFGAMIVYVSTIGGGEYVLLSGCACAGMALHCLSRNYYFSYSGMIQLVTTVVTSFGVFTMASLQTDPPAAAAATFFGGLGVTAFFVMNYRRIIQERLAFFERLQAEKQDDKMRALGQFTSGVAHDFNNLLTVVNGNIELAKLDPDGLEFHRYLEEAHAAGLKGAALIQQLLAFARKSKIVVSDIDVAALLSRIEGILNRVLPAHIALLVTQNCEDAKVRGDVAMLQSAIINLVINARDALGDTPGKIFVSIKAYGTEEIEIDISDTGPGMDKETMARATEPFFTTKAVGEGSGLGLSMVTGVVAQCGGRFELQNRLGGGLSARIYLPVALGDAPRRIPLEDTARTL